MAYEKNTWASGDVVTSAKLNHMENGIEAASSPYDLVIVADTTEYDGDDITTPISAYQIVSGSIEACEQTIVNMEPITVGLFFFNKYGVSQTINTAWTYPFKYLSIAYKTISFEMSSINVAIAYASDYSLTYVSWES